MRLTFLKTLWEEMERDPSLYVISADTGFHIFDDFQKTFSDRYMNIGISEAAMIGVAAGLAMSGRRVFCYGIAPFVTLRCLEQIRLDLCVQPLPVTVVGVGQGLTYGPAGVSHHSIEDIAVLSALPNMTVVCPGDPDETRQAVRAITRLDGPCYLRLGKTGEPSLHSDESEGVESFRLGRAIRLRAGDNADGGLALIGTGNMLEAAIQTADLLRQRAGIGAEVVSMHTVKPLDRACVLDLSRRRRIIATLEEHSIHGGLGAAVAAVIAEAGGGARLRPFAIPDAFASTGGGRDFLREQFGLTPPQIAEALEKEIR